MAMAINQEELQIIGEYVQSHLTEWLPEHVSTQPEFAYPIELIERMIRVEEELKNQRELMKQGFEQTDKRIELLQINMDKRFEQVDKRFEQMQHNMDKRFDQVDKRFEQTDKNFNEVNSSIKSLQTKMFQFMIWSFGFTATVAGIIIAVIKFM
jgi:chromosome segregation ATPase